MTRPEPETAPFESRLARILAAKAPPFLRSWFQEAVEREFHLDAELYQAMPTGQVIYEPSFLQSASLVVRMLTDLHDLDPATAKRLMAMPFRDLLDFYGPEPPRFVRH